MSGALRAAEGVRAVVEARWPRVAEAVWGAPAPAAAVDGATLVVEGLHLSSRVDPLAEVRRQAALVPEEAERAWLHGIAMGHLPRVLLERPRLARLDVVLYRPPLLARIAEREALEWLADPRVTLHLARHIERPEAPLAVAPACLRLAEEAAVPLRDRVQLLLDSAYLNERFRHDPRVAEQIGANRDRVAADGDAAELFGTLRGRGAVIAATGPTLADHFDRLRRWRAEGRFLIALDASLRPLAAEGIVPDLVISVDENRAHLERLFDLDLSPLAAVPLVYFPAVHPAVLARWPGPRLAAYSPSPVYDALARELPRPRLFCNGSVLHAAVDLARCMEADPVVLLGADLAYPSGHSHVRGAVFDQPVAPGPGYEWVADGHGGRVLTTRNLRGYLRDLEDYLARHPGLRLVSGSRRGARIEGVLMLEEVDDGSWH